MRNPPGVYSGAHGERAWQARYRVVREGEARSREAGKARSGTATTGNVWQEIGAVASPAAQRNDSGYEANDNDNS